MARHTLRALQVSPPDVTVTVKSQIPIASGLGSGAAVSTALARALGLWFHRPFDNEVLNGLVYEVEKLHHGTPSGIDNTVVVYEQPVYFVRDNPVEFVLIGSPFSLLIADTGQTALTHAVVGDVRALYEADQRRVQPILDEIGEIAVEARLAIESGEIKILGTLMNRNHDLLQQLTVSSPELDRLVAAALDAGALGAKLSGGGRGGNMITIVEREVLEMVKHALLSAGATRVFHTVVG